MTTTRAYIGIIIVLTVVVISYFGWRYWKKRHGTEHFSLSTPATPRVREAVGDLFVSLKHMVSLGLSFQDQVDRAGRTDLAGARQSVAQITKTLGAAEKQLGGVPPTYVNYLAVYRGLTSTDRTLLSASDTYATAGLELHQQAATTGSGDDVTLGNSLMAIGRQLRHVVAGVHRLGVALDVE